jgi:hypothetical protein
MELVQLTEPAASQLAFLRLLRGDIPPEPDPEPAPILASGTCRTLGMGLGASGGAVSTSSAGGWSGRAQLTILTHWTREA